MLFLHCTLEIPICSNTQFSSKMTTFPRAELYGWAWTRFSREPLVADDCKKSISYFWGCPEICSLLREPSIVGNFLIANRTEYDITYF